jgi:hypothetical protein
MKATKQTSEGADVLLDDFYLLTAILVIAQALYPNFHAWLPLCEIRKIFIQQKFVCVRYNMIK